MTFLSLKNQLKQAGIEEADTEARLLLSHFFGISPAALYAEPLREYESEDLTVALARRLAREPLAYILGEIAFFEESYLVNSNCLIPRADTELLVEKAIELLPHGAHFADLCTGSGCIAISVLTHRKDTSALAADISDAALAIAQKNAERNGVSSRLTFIKEDILSPKVLKKDSFDVILSNPPYIRADVVPTLAPELSFEPSLALCGGDDGLIFYRKMLSYFSPALFFFEIGYDQGEALYRLGKENGFTAEICKDAGGNDRLAILRR